MRAAASGRLPAIQLEISQLVHPERLLSQAAVIQTTRKTVLYPGPEGDAIKSISGIYPDAKIKIVELPYSTLREQLVSSSISGLNAILRETPEY